MSISLTKSFVIEIIPYSNKSYRSSKPVNPKIATNPDNFLITHFLILKDRNKLLQPSMRTAYVLGLTLIAFAGYRFLSVPTKSLPESSIVSEAVDQRSPRKFLFID